MSVRQYYEVNREVKWMSVRQYNEVNRAVQWMSDNTMR